MIKDVEMVNGIPEIHPSRLSPQLGQVRLIDVRRPEEFNDNLGHIAGAELVELGPDLEKFLQDGDRDEAIVFICKSGGRSARATMVASQALGYRHVANMTGGMLQWNHLGLPVERA